jgi:hypothetical protein
MKKKYKSPRNSGQPSSRKFKGFGFYLMSNEKLSKTNRETLLIKSEEYIGEVIKSLNLSTEDLMNSDVIGELDPKLTDLELLEEWNHMYDTYGYLMSDFKEKWEKERLKGEPSFKPNSKFEYHSEIEELKQRITQLEMEVKKLKMKGSNRFQDLG